MDRKQGAGIINRYREHLPVSSRTPVITLHEGETPLLPSVSIGPRLGITLYFKFEGLNPTGSFKDRGMTMAVSRAREEGKTALVCASTGNTSASAAAYAARAGLKALVILPEGKIARGKLAQALIHGARVIPVRGNFDQALELVRALSRHHPVAVVNSINPFRIEGQKTAAFEIIDRLGDAPGYHALPVGNAGNITAYWQGFREYRELGRCQRLPKMLGFQASGAAPLVHGQPVEHPETMATAIRIGNPASWRQALAARDESGGVIDMVSDEEISAASRRLAAEEGIFAEPASAAAIAGITRSAAAGFFPRGAVVTATLTGHGLKDPDFAVAACPCPETVPADLEHVVAAAGL